MTPERFIAKCEFCGQHLDIRSEGVHQRTSGWVMVRNGGGGHGISLPEREKRWACRSCIDSKSKGTFGQKAMFS
jgi:UPF0288 family protein (methanogenesis marker protein 3)